MPRRCPECGGELSYNRDLKMHVCTTCGRMFTREELEDTYDRLMEEERRSKGRRKAQSI